MSVNGIKPFINEYRLIWKALKRYEVELEELSSYAFHEGLEKEYDEKLQDIDALLKALRVSAKKDYDLDLN